MGVIKTMACIAASLAVFVSTAVIAQSPADQIKVLLESGKVKEAYAAGKASNDSLGDPYFDFYFGIAALGAGAPGEGTLALERFLAHHPTNRSARFHLARGFFVLGEDLRSREEFLAILDASDADEQIVIQAYLDAIRARTSRYIPTGSFYAEFSAGHDSNINSGLDAGPVSGMSFLIIPHGATQEEESDSFASWGIGANGVHPIAPGVAIYGGVNAFSRSPLSGNNDQFQYQEYGLRGGMHVLKGKTLYRFGVDANAIRLDEQNYLNAVSLVGEWQYQANQFNRWGVGASLGRLDYEDIYVHATKDKSTPPSLSKSNIRDSGLWSISGTWTRNFELPWSPVWGSQLYIGQEDNRNQRQDLSINFWGAKTGVTVRPKHRWALSTDLGYRRNDYQDDYFPGMQERSDDLWILDASIRYFLTNKITISGHAYYLDQQSNIGLHDVKRHAYWIKIRYDYK